jgi:SOS response regulatory protein OraA/RecX
VPPEAAQQVLDRLEAGGLGDDERLARDWVESRPARRHLSRSALRRGPGQGADRDDIEAALEQVSRDDDSVGPARSPESWTRWLDLATM